MTAWALLNKGYEVDIFERDSVMAGTSSTSTKLIHGGLRYLEHGEFRLVRESLKERTWWIERCPELVHPIEILLPIVKGVSRPKWILGIGLFLYDFLAGKQNPGSHKWYSQNDLLTKFKDYPLKADDIRGAYGFFDCQMDDYALGRWAAERVISKGGRIFENTPVLEVRNDGGLRTPNGWLKYDLVVNAAGPWAKELIVKSDLKSPYDLDWVRGSHIVLKQKVPAGLMLQVPNDTRIVFVLPYKDNTLVGTTEVRQESSEPIECSNEEMRYLLAAYNSYFKNQIAESDVIETFAGVRPLIHSSGPVTKASREYALERQEKLINVFGGKWTTSRVLGIKVAEEAQKALR